MRRYDPGAELMHAAMAHTLTRIDDFVPQVNNTRAWHPVPNFDCPAFDPLGHRVTPPFSV